MLVAGHFDMDRLHVWLCLSAVFVAAVLPARAAIDPNTLRCLVCRSTIDEFESDIKKLDPKKMVEVGNYRLDEAGNIHQIKVPLSRSQVHLSEMVDEVCKRMADYVRVKYKATQKLAVMKMMSDSGGMNPEFSYTDFVTDEDLNKSLEFYCDGIIGENEDELVEIYTKRSGNALPDGKSMFCNDHLNLCEEWMLPTEADRNWSPEKEQGRGPNPYGFGGMPPSNDYEDAEEIEEDVGELELKANDKEEL